MACLDGKLHLVCYWLHLPFIVLLAFGCHWFALSLSFLLQGPLNSLCSTRVKQSVYMAGFASKSCDSSVDGTLFVCLRSVLLLSTPGCVSVHRANAFVGGPA